MTNQEKINLIGQKILILSGNLDNYQRELEILKQQLAALQQAASYPPQQLSVPPVQKTQVPPVEKTPEPIIEKPKPLVTEINTAQDVTTVRNPDLKSQPVPTKTTEAFNFEAFIGGKLITIIGIIILVIGLGIGVKYAIDNNLITPLTRIILAYLAGGILLLLALKLKAKYTSFSAVLLSGGMASLYFTTFAAYSLYNLFPQAVAFLLMVIFTLFIVFAATVYNLQVIGVIGLVGAYGVPMLLSDGSGRIEIMFSYMLIINTGILILSFRRYWLVLHFLAFGLSWLIVSTWFADKFDPAQHTWMLLGFSFAFFIQFYTGNLAYKLIKKEKFRELDIISTLINSIVFYAIGYACLNHNATSSLLGLFTVLNALVHFIASALIYKNKLVDRKLFFLLISMVITFITLTIPVQLDGNWVTLLWSVEALLLFGLGRIKTIRFYEVLGFVMIYISLISLMHDWSGSYFQYSYDDENFKFWSAFSNATFFTSLVATACIASIFYLHRKYNIEEQQRFFQVLSTLINISLPILLFILSYATFNNEIQASMKAWYQRSMISVPVNSAWAEPGAVNDCYNYTIVLLKDVALTAFSLTYFSSALVIVNKKTKNKIVHWVAFGFAVLTVLLFLTAGLAQLGSLRKAYLVTPDPNYFPAPAYLVYIRYGVFLLFSVLLFCLHQLLKNKSFQAIQFPKLFRSCLLPIIVLIILSNELLNLNSLLNFTPGDSYYTINKTAYKLGLTALWGVYSFLMIAWGIYKKDQWLRITAISVVGLTLIKLLIFDTWDLSTGYKVVSYLSLGIILLVVAFLYQKFKGFLFGESIDKDKH